MAGQDDKPIPGLQLDEKLAAKLDSLDDHLEPIEKDLHEDAGKSKSKEEPKEDPEKEEPVEEPGEEEEPEAGDGEEPGEGEAEPAGDGDDDEGYTIDEGDEEVAEDPKVPESPKDQGEPDTRQLNPEQKYILDNIQPIKVRGYVGDSDKIEEFDVYAPEYLPQGFKFVDEREMQIASRAFSQLEQRAVQLQNDWRTQETQKQTEDFKRREDTADRQDIATLQRDGKIPRFKADPNSAAFEKDPGVQLVQEVLDFKEAQNKKYMDEYNAGRPYKHIGFDEAFRMYQRDNPTKSNPRQTKEDQERTSMAKRTSKSNGSSTQPDRPKARAHSGMSTFDLDNLIESKTADW